MGVSKKVKNFYEDIDNQIKYAKWIAIHSAFHKKKMLSVLALGCTSSLTAIAFSLLVKTIIDSATGKVIPYYNLLAYALLMVFSEIISVLLNYYSVTFDEKIKYSLRKHLFGIIIRSDWLKITAYKNGDLQTRLTNDIEKIATGISNLIPDMISFSVQLIITFVVLFYFSPLIAGAALGTGLIGALVCILFKGKLYKLQMNVQESESKSRSFLNENCSNLTVVKSFSLENIMVNKLNNLQDEQYRAVTKRAKVNQKTSIMMNFVFDLAYIIAFTLGVVTLTQGMISYGTLSMYIVLAGYIQQPMMSIASNIPRIIWMLASAGRIKEIEGIKQEKLESLDPEGKEFGLKAENISFSYKSSEPIFKNASFNIKPGEFVAIVGESGSGKTTLIRLLLSLITPTSGKISFVTKSGENISSGILTRMLVGYVPQGNTLISGTLAENIRFGCSFATEKDIMEALRIADAEKFVEKMEDGLDTIIGENGIGLSEGQAQRIAIARAIIRNAPVLILDEATSALDKETEKRILNNLSSLEIRPTCFFVTHRASALEICDRVLKVKNGTINDETKSYK